jgi:hypothetical protein
MGSLTDTLAQRDVAPQEVVKVFEQYRNFRLSIKEQTPVAVMDLRQHRGIMTTKTTIAPMIVGSNRCSFTNRLQDLARKKETLKSMSDFLVRFTTVTWTSITTAFVPTHSGGKRANARRAWRLAR